jgi:putative PIN family toxin of toxin-antitoxin system
MAEASGQQQNKIMPKRRDGITVVIDTNVFVANFLSRSPHSPNRRVVRSWMVDRRIRLTISREILAEYLQVFAELLDFDNEKPRNWRHRFREKKSCKIVVPRTKRRISRDPDDNMFIAAAVAAKAAYLITNDLDLLEIDDADKERLKFEIVTPRKFLDQWD